MHPTNLMSKLDETLGALEIEHERDEYRFDIEFGDDNKMPVPEDDDDEDCEEPSFKFKAKVDLYQAKPGVVAVEFDQIDGDQWLFKEKFAQTKKALTEEEE